MAHIVVAIPAVEDSDLPETLRHLYALSSRQHELTVVVHEQCSTHGQLAADELPWHVPWYDADRHRYIYLHSGEARGYWPARRHISSHLREQDITGDYGMVIDSHTRFRANWDNDLITLHSRARHVAWLGQTTTDAVKLADTPSRARLLHAGKVDTLIPVSTEGTPRLKNRTPSGKARALCLVPYRLSMAFLRGEYLTCLVLQSQSYSFQED